MQRYIRKKPIDAGITQFCHACKKCGEMCPSGAISFVTELNAMDIKLLWYEM